MARDSAARLGVAAISCDQYCFERCLWAQPCLATAESGAVCRDTSGLWRSWSRLSPNTLLRQQGRLRPISRHRDGDLRRGGEPKYGLSLVALHDIAACGAECAP